MIDVSIQEYEQLILKRLQEAGPEGLTKNKGLHQPAVKSPHRQAFDEAFSRLEAQQKIIKKYPRYVLVEHFNPSEEAYEHLVERAAQLTSQRDEQGSLVPASKTMLLKAAQLSSAAKQKVDEALSRLVEEKVLLPVLTSGRTSYFHASELGKHLSQTSSQMSEMPVSEDLIRKAYQETVKSFGYEDVPIHDVFLRLNGAVALRPFLNALMKACEDGRAIPNMGDWAISSEERRSAAIYLDGEPYLRIRFVD